MVKHMIGNDSRRKRAALWAVAGVLAVAFAGSAAGKLLASDEMATVFEGWGYPGWFMIVVGVAEGAGALLVLAPGRTVLGASLRFWGATGLVVLMVGAVGTHVVHAEPAMIPPTVLLGGLAGVLGTASRPRWLRGRDSA